MPPDGRQAQGPSQGGETRMAPPPPPPPMPPRDAELGSQEPVQDAGFGDPEASAPQHEEATPAYGQDVGAEPPLSTTTTPVVTEPPKQGGLKAKLGRRGQGGEGQGALLVAGWSLLGLFVVGVLAVFLLMPAAVMAALPGSAHLYQALGVTPAEEAELGFQDVDYAWTRYQGQRMLQVEGQIVNFTPEEMPTPNVLIALLDGDGEKISEWMAPAGETGVPASGTSQFATQIPSPPDTVRAFRVRFQKEG